MQESTAICSAVLEAINESIATQSSHTSPLGMTRRFAARLEVPVPSDSDKRSTSYLDILMETDEAAVGIEAKFWAQFQPDQPKKYLSVVEKAKKALSDMPPPSDARGVLVVLAPEGKLAGGEAKERIREADVAGRASEIPCIGVPWERVLYHLKQLKGSGDLSPTVAVILDEFILFLETNLSLEVDFEGAYPFLRGQWHPRGSDHQMRMLWSLWGLFPGTSSRIGRFKDYMGYYFYSKGASSDQAIEGWFGFAENKILTTDNPSPNAAELIVDISSKGSDITDLEIPLSDAFVPCDVAWPSKNRKTWIVSFDRSWKRKSKWAEEILPFSSPDLWHPDTDD
jgi:hypothetical protein